MSEKTVYPDHVQAALLEGKIEHRWDFFGSRVVMKLFGSGKKGYGEILKRAIGPDDYTREYWRNLLQVAYSLKSFGGWDFDSDQDKKEEFVEGLAPHVMMLFFGELQRAQIDQQEHFQKRIDLLKKSSPDQT